MSTRTHMSLERLTPAASMHLKGADRQNLGVLVLVTPGEHGPPTIEQVRTHVLARLDRVRRLRQRLQPVPGRIALPVSIDDENFDIRRHVVPLGVPAPVSTKVVEIWRPVSCSSGSTSRAHRGRSRTSPSSTPANSGSSSVPTTCSAAA